jgi:hypothetical protein
MILRPCTSSTCFVQTTQEVRLCRGIDAFLYALEPQQFVEVPVERGGRVRASTGSYLLTHALIAVWSSNRRERHNGPELILDSLFCLWLPHQRAAKKIHGRPFLSHEGAFIALHATIR